MLLNIRNVGASIRLNRSLLSMTAPLRTINKSNGMAGISHRRIGYKKTSDMVKLDADLA